MTKLLSFMDDKLIVPGHLAPRSQVDDVIGATVVCDKVDVHQICLSTIRLFVANDPAFDKLASEYVIMCSLPLHISFSYIIM